LKRKKWVVATSPSLKAVPGEGGPEARGEGAEEARFATASA